ncbi:MAG TPA: hypothetical protein VFZ59_07960 [Verrucomicrobiae bacterium]|nr:hypothetical protein [Verrucomicrobiae bacterium]
MKRLFVLSVAFAPMLVQAQLNPLQPITDAELATYTHSYVFGIPEMSYGRIVGERVVYSGISVQLLRAPNPLQLINPWAPEEYGPSDQNLAIDPVTKRAAGLRLFAISF